jgi:hypothetical protein
MTLFSSSGELKRIGHILSKYVRLPFATNESIPGAVMMGILADVRGAEVLDTYDFVDVIKPASRIGWQVKSTKTDTPVTWKRAKIPDKTALISASEKGAKGVQALGDAIITFCNDHAVHSLERYDLDEIGYSRLVVHRNGTATYFERLLCSRKAPQLFNPADFRWEWSKQKQKMVKEQLTALHGYHIPTGDKWWAWHGRGENQLHFCGEWSWWPSDGATNSIVIRLPDPGQKMSMKEFVDLLA